VKPAVIHAPATASKPATIPQPAMAEMQEGSAPEFEFGNQLDIEPEAENPPGAEDPARQWTSLQTRLDLTGAVREFARQIQLESIDRHKWKFLVPDTLQHLGSDSVVQGLKTALASHLGHEVKLDLHGASEPLKSVAAAATRAEVKRMSEAERAIEEDPTVQELKKEFGAKIVPDSIQPIQ